LTNQIDFIMQSECQRISNGKFADLRRCVMICVCVIDWSPFGKYNDLTTG